MLGLHFCARVFSSCGERGPLFIAVRGPLTITASLVAEHRLQTRRLSSCGSRAQFLHGMWDLPRPGLEPASPALAGRLSTTVPPGKPWYWVFITVNYWEKSMVGTFYSVVKLSIFKSQLCCLFSCITLHKSLKFFLPSFFIIVVCKLSHSKYSGSFTYYYY